MSSSFVRNASRIAIGALLATILSLPAQADVADQVARTQKVLSEAPDAAALFVPYEKGGLRHLASGASCMLFANQVYLQKIETRPTPQGVRCDYARDDGAGVKIALTVETAAPNSALADSVSTAEREIEATNPHATHLPPQLRVIHMGPAMGWLDYRAEGFAIAAPDGATHEELIVGRVNGWTIEVRATDNLAPDLTALTYRSRAGAIAQFVQREDIYSIFTAAVNGIAEHETPPLFGIAMAVPGCDGSGYPGVQPLVFAAGDRTVADGLSASVKIGIAYPKAPAILVAQDAPGCRRGEFTLGTATYTVSGDDHGKPQRWATSPSDPARIAYVALMPKPDAAAEAFKGVTDPEHMQLSFQPDQMMFALVVAEGDLRRVYRFYERVPDNARVAQEMCMALAGEIAPLGSLDTASRQADFSRLGDTAPPVAKSACHVTLDEAPQ